MTKNLDLQSWHEVPSIAHFCSLFREAFKLFEFDIQELEESLLLHGTDDDCDQLVAQLLVSLLQGCLPSFKKRINRENFNKYLRQFLITKREDAEEEGHEYYFDNPFEEEVDSEKDFSDLELRDKVRVLHHLCELRLVAPDVGERVKNLDCASLRVDPLGVDSVGTTLWYFYGTRLYKEERGSDLDKSERKRRKKHKKLKKKRRKKSRESVESVESVASSEAEEEADTQWSVACSTEEDWEELVARYKQSERREDRKLYRLLHDCFLPEIREMFVEKRREDKKKMQQQLSRRSSSRVEVLKKQQEEKDRQLALQLAKDAKKAKNAGRETRGRKRGRKRKNKSTDDEDDDGEDEENEEDVEEEDEDSGDLQGDREERAKQREMMKEMRARREAEKMVESKFREEVLQQRARAKEGNSGRAKKLRKVIEKEVGRKPKKPVRFEDTTEDSEDTAASRTSAASETSSRDQSPDLGASEGDSDDVYTPPRQPSGRTHFSNALIRAGTKSTKDSSLEKEKQKSIKEILTEKPVVRKTPGLLLQSAGKGLLNKTKEVTKENSETEAAIRKPSSGISFGLWGGHLPVEQSIISNSLSSTYDDKPLSISEDKKEESTKKVFSNWGGDFFKKNLDFRANTNRILEKLSKSASDVNGSTNGSANSNGVS